MRVFGLSNYEDSPSTAGNSMVIRPQSPCNRRPGRNGGEVQRSYEAPRL